MQSVQQSNEHAGTSWIWKKNENQKYSHPPARAIHFQTASPKIEMSWIDESSIQLKYLSWIESHELNRFSSLSWIDSAHFNLSWIDSAHFNLSWIDSAHGTQWPVQWKWFSLVFEQQQQRFDSIQFNSIQFDQTYPLTMGLLLTLKHSTNNKTD